MMATLMLTKLGDVLILQTERGVKIHAVGRVSENGQQDFHRVQPSPSYIVDHDEALAVARSLVTPGGRVYLMKVASDTWSLV